MDPDEEEFIEERKQIDDNRWVVKRRRVTSGSVWKIERGSFRNIGCVTATIVVTLMFWGLFCLTHWGPFLIAGIILTLILVISLIINIISFFTRRS